MKTKQTKIKKEYVAMIQIKGLSKMSNKEFIDMIKWLNQKGLEIFTCNRKDYADTYTLRLMK